MHPFSTLWKRQGLEKRCIGNEWINQPIVTFYVILKKGWEKAQRSASNYINM